MDISRIVFQQIQKRLSSNKVLVLLGSRRVGKTHLLDKIMREYDGKKLFLLGEDLDTADLFANRRVAAYKRWLNDVDLLIVDEAQVIPEVGKALKLMIDSFKNLTILITGSSAFDLTNQTGEPLVGRREVFHLYPIAQSELSTTESFIETRQNLENRLLYGGYPELFSLATSAEKENYLKEIINSYLLKDILMFEQVQHSNKMLQLLKLVAYQIGSEVSYDQLAKQLQISRNTVEHYLDLFSKVFVIFRIGGFSRNLRKELTKSSKWYFHDVGLRNALLNNFESVATRPDIGALWENYIISERVKYLTYERRRENYFFWRTYDQQELDWVETKDNEISGFEIKWGKSTKEKYPIAFRKAYPDANLYWVNQETYLEHIDN